MGTKFTNNDILNFQNMFDYIKDLIFLMEPEGDSFRYVYANQQALKKQDIVDNIIGMLIEEALPEDRAQFLLSKYQQVYHSLQPLDFIEILKLDNGEYIGETQLNPIITEDGQCKYILAIVRDITERVRKENELKETKKNLEENQKRLNSLFENNVDPVFEVDLKGNFIRANNAAEKITGYKTDEIIGKSFAEFVSGEYIEYSKMHFQKVLTGRNEEYEIWASNKNGNKIQINLKHVPIIIDGKISGIYVIARDITEQTKMRQQLAQMAYYDYLSGLPNRRIFQEKLDAAIYSADRTNKKVAVMMLDGRKFKQINDTYGHDAGDAVIVDMARRLQQSVRKSDTVARIGGDEMAIILPNLDSEEEAEEIAKRIAASFHEPLIYKGIKIKIGAGIGISIYPDHSKDPVELVKFADIALFRAKAMGEDMYDFYNYDFNNDF